MTGVKVNPDADIFLRKIQEVEDQANQHAAAMKRLVARLSRARKLLKNTSSLVAQVTSLISDLEQQECDLPVLSVAALSSSLKEELSDFKERISDKFPYELRDACDAAEIQFKAKLDGYAVGTFFVTIDVDKESAAFHFAKIDMRTDVPLNAKAIVEKATSLTASLLDEPVDRGAFESALNEAMRVVMARQDKTPNAEWRVDLPLVYRELAFIRQSQTKRHKASQISYSQPRFVVELKDFIQSPENLDARKQYRLETAVLENAKNPKKAMFIPQDVSRAFGEGTYYQSILLRLA